MLYDDGDYGYKAVLVGFQVKLVTKAILNKGLFFADDDRVTQVQKGKWKLYYQIRNGVYFNHKYGKNFGVRSLRSLGIFIKYQGFVVKNFLHNKKYELSDLKVFYDAYRDGMKGRLGKREH